jgi:ADP-heptose:LPS heptosyltransferase
LGWGDEVVAAGQAQRLYDADPSTRVAVVGGDGRPRWHAMFGGNPIIATPEEVAAGERVRTVVNGPNARPYIVYPFTKDTGWTFNKDFHCRDHIARIYLTPEERGRGEQARKQYGRYVLIEPYTKHENFTWPMDRWCALVKACPELTFVQHIHADSRPCLVPGAHYEQATFREACGLVAEADLYVRSESGLCHAAAALGTKQITMFGGCMDADVMGGYPGQTVLVDQSQETPCGRWHACEHCKSAMERLTVDEVSSAMRAALRPKRERKAVAHAAV